MTPGDLIARRGDLSMEIRLDLHIHSEYSPDGRMKIGEIISQAKQAGLHGAAICDHDHVWTDGGLLDSPDFVIIPGVEISTEYGHLLGWFLDRPIHTRDFKEAVKAIHEQGGIAVLAHPFEHTRSDDKIAGIANLLDGAEVWNGRAERKNRQANAMAKSFAEKYALNCYAGSDAHVPREIGNGVTTIRININHINHHSINPADTPGINTPEIFNAIRAELLSGRTRTDGKRGRAADVAASQFTRLKKSNADWISCCKWAAFAVKCCLSDFLDKIISR